MNGDRRKVKNNNSIVWKMINVGFLIASTVAGWVNTLEQSGPVDVPGWLGPVLLVASFGVIIIYFSFLRHSYSAACSFSMSPFSFRMAPLNCYYIGSILLIAFGLAGLLAALFVAPERWRIALPNLCMGLGAMAAVKLMARSS